MRFARLPLMLASILLAVSCAKPPQAEIDAAKAAVTAAAKNADVVTYAPDSLRVAQEKIAALDEEIGAQGRRAAISRKYETAQRLAADAAAGAARTVADAGAAKEQVAKEAAALIEKVGASIPSFESKVWAARRVRGIRLDFAGLGRAAVEARAALADALKDLVAGAFAAAKAKATAVEDRLAEAEENVTAQIRVTRGR